MNLILLFSCLTYIAVAETNCKNGNFCQENETCLGAVTIAQNASVFVGQKYGCAPFNNATSCDDMRYSCPDGSKCETSEKTSVCFKSEEEVKFNATENRDSESYIRAKAGSVCDILRSDLPASCTCKDSTLGAALDCKTNVFGQEIGMYADFMPCDHPAHMGVTVYDSTLGIHYDIGQVSLGHSMHIPIPGISIQIPYIKTGAGLYAVVSLQGNVQELTILLGLDICAMLLRHKVCGSSITSYFPLNFLSGTFPFDEICEHQNKQAKIATV